MKIGSIICTFEKLVLSSEQRKELHRVKFWYKVAPREKEDEYRQEGDTSEAESIFINFSPHHPISQDKESCKNSQKFFKQSPPNNVSTITISFVCSFTQQNFSQEGFIIFASPCPPYTGSLIPILPPSLPRNQFIVTPGVPPHQSQWKITLPSLSQTLSNNRTCSNTVFLISRIPQVLVFLLPH